MKINKINVNTNLSFKNKDADSEVKIQKQEKRNLALSLALGAASSLLYSAKTKNPLNNIKTLEFGSAIALGSGFLFEILTLANEVFKGAEQFKENKKKINYDEQIKKYEKDFDKGLNGFDKFVNSLSKPMPKDFGNEEKNKEYYLKTKKDMVKLTKSFIYTMAATGLSAVATAVFCKAKKIPDANGKILTGSLITGTIGALISSLSYSITKEKGDR